MTWHVEAHGSGPIDLYHNFHAAVSDCPAIPPTVAHSILSAASLLIASARDPAAVGRLATEGRLDTVGKGRYSVEINV